jgi:hypothetical protein
VVYESMFSNTEEIARAIADGLGDLLGVQLAEVSDAPREPDRSRWSWQEVQHTCSQ